MGSEIDVAFFWTNILMRSSLSGGIALFPHISGTICQFEHKPLYPNLSSGNEKRKILVLVLLSA